MDNRVIEIVKTAMTPYRLNLEPGQRVLIVTDTGTDPVVTQAFAAAAHALGIIPTTVVMLPVPFHHADPDPVALAAMREVDLVHLVTSRAVIHSEPTHRLQLEGKRFIASEEITLEMLRAGGTTADYERMNRLGDVLHEIFTNGRSLHVTSDEGTDLRADITGRPSWLAAGKVRDNPGCDLYACGFPDGECGVSPIEGSIEGTVVWDTSMHHVGLIDEPIRATIREGRAVAIDGGAEAQRLRTYLEEHGDDGSWIIGETSLGLNEKARITGFVREDKKLLGCMHIALGMNTDTGGKVASRTHLDGVVRRPTVVVDDQVIAKDGRILIDVD